MTDAERDELIEKSLLQTLDSAGEARVQQLRRNDADFNQAYAFQETLIQQVRLKRRQELLTMFAGFEAEQAAQAGSDATTPVIPLPIAPGQTETVTPANPTLNMPGAWAAVRDVPPKAIIPANPTAIPLWQQAGFRVAATVALATLVGAIVWWQLASYSPKPIAHAGRDSVRTRPPVDSPSRKPVPSPSPAGACPPGTRSAGPTGATARSPAGTVLRNGQHKPGLWAGIHRCASTARFVFGIGPVSCLRIYRHADRVPANITRSQTRRVAGLQPCY